MTEYRQVGKGRFLLQEKLMKALLALLGNGTI